MGGRPVVCPRPAAAGGGLRGGGAARGRGKDLPPLDPADDRGGHRYLDVVPRRTELGAQCGPAGGDRKGCGDELDHARARRCPRNRGRRSGVRRQWQLRVGGRLHRRLRGCDGGHLRALGPGRSRRRRAPCPDSASSAEPGAGRRKVMVTRTVVQYRVKEGVEEENAALVRAVYRELAERAPAGFRYATYRLEDGRTFIHVAEHNGEGDVPLRGLVAFSEFQAEVRERCESGPVVSSAELVGRFETG